MSAKARTVRLTEAAEDDLRSIARYLRQHESAEAARRLLRRILDKADKLEQFPDRGSMPAELEALGFTQFRQTLMSPYRILYEATQAEVIVFLIADGRRDMKALLERRLLG